MQPFQERKLIRHGYIGEVLRGNERNDLEGEQFVEGGSGGAAVGPVDRERFFDAVGELDEPALRLEPAQFRLLLFGRQPLRLFQPRLLTCRRLGLRLGLHLSPTQNEETVSETQNLTLRSR